MAGIFGVRRFPVKLSYLMVTYRGFRPAGARSSRTGAASSRKANTRCELALRSELWKRGRRYQIDVSSLPGRPDIVFSKWKLAIFCDGDFWHGRNLRTRLRKLHKGHNAPYWVAKLKSNVARDRRNSAKLRKAGWTVVRVWEGDILRDPVQQADLIEAALRSLGANF